MEVKITLGSHTVCWLSITQLYVYQQERVTSRGWVHRGISGLQFAVGPPPASDESRGYMLSTGAQGQRWPSGAGTGLAMGLAWVHRLVTWSSFNWRHPDERENVIPVSLPDSPELHPSLQALKEKKGILKVAFENDLPSSHTRSLHVANGPVM